MNIIPNDDNLPDFTIYDVEFTFGCLTLHGSELRAMQRGAMGMIAHTEFEFLKRKIESARGVAQAARQEFEEHAATHRC